MGDGGFDYGRIPDYVYHDAVQDVLGAPEYMLTGGNGNTPYNFRCPICGDSQTRKFMKRGYIFHDIGDIWMMHCHRRCGSRPFINYLEEYEPDIYKQVIFHAFSNPTRKKTKNSDNHTTEAEKTFVITGAAIFKSGELIKITDDHPTAKIALTWCRDERKIRKAVYEKWFVCLKDDKFKDRDVNGNFIYNDRNVPTGNEYGNRIIIPYYRYGGKWSQFDARDINKKSLLRYRNISGASSRQPYNIDWLDVTQPFYLLEGAIDSSFLQNAIGFGGTKHLKALFQQRPDILQYAHNGTIIMDNDDAGRDEVPWLIELGFNWFNWYTIKPAPEFEFKSDGSHRIIKDINDLVIYTHLIERNIDEFIVSDCLKKYIEIARGGLLKFTILYGDRKQIQLEKRLALKQEVKVKRESKRQMSFNWD